MTKPSTLAATNARLNRLDAEYDALCKSYRAAQRLKTKAGRARASDLAEVMEAKATELRALRGHAERLERTEARAARAAARPTNDQLEMFA